MNHSTHSVGSTVSSASETNSHALPSSQPPDVRRLMATSDDECVSPPPSFQSDRTGPVLPVCYGAPCDARRIVLFRRALGRILKVHCFPEYWFFRSPAERSALIKARLKVGLYASRSHRRRCLRGVSRSGGIDRVRRTDLPLS